LRPEAFYTPAHQILFDLVADLVDSNKPILLFF
jgi:replicative DNA helicase